MVCYCVQYNIYADVSCHAIILMLLEHHRGYILFSILVRQFCLVF